MEVHHHPELHHKKKQFKEYFLEFLMIFLAVTMGFFAESLRESIVDNDKENYYLKSLVHDLQKDTSEMRGVLAGQNYFITKMDSALRIPAKDLHDVDKQDTFYHYFAFFYSWVFTFFQHDNTLAQLKNAGGFSVIRNKDIISAVGELNLFYDQQVKYNGDFYNDFWKKVVELGAHIIKMPQPPVRLDDTLFDKLPHHMEVFTRYDQPLLEELYTWIRNEKGTLLVYMDNEIKYRDQAIQLIDLIKKESHVNSE
jgi:hypothetical protein